VFPRDIVCFRNICINTLHKRDNDDEDNNKQVEAAYKAERINIAEYLNTNYKEDQL
jgi:hypothetical protein